MITTCGLCHRTIQVLNEDEVKAPYLCERCRPADDQLPKIAPSRSTRKAKEKKDDQLPKTDSPELPDSFGD